MLVFGGERVAVDQERAALDQYHCTVTGELDNLAAILRPKEDNGGTLDAPRDFPGILHREEAVVDDIPEHAGDLHPDLLLQRIVLVPEGPAERDLVECREFCGAFCGTLPADVIRDVLMVRHNVPHGDVGKGVISIW